MNRRTGTVLIAVLVCLGIASVITLTSVRSSLRHRRELRRQWQLEQTRWLLEAAVIRTREQSRSDEDYSGEAWDVSTTLPAYDKAIVTIQPADSESQEASWSVTATIGSSSDDFMTTQRTLTLEFPE